MNIIIAFVAALALPSIASAHVVVEPKSAPAGAYQKLTFRVGHGCDHSPTTEIVVSIPKGVTSVKPQVHTGWTITTKKTGEDVTEVSFKGGPLDDAFMDEFGMSVKLPELAGETLVFSVVQNCQKGKSEWTGAPEATFPAPRILLEKTTSHEHHSH